MRAGRRRDETCQNALLKLKFDHEQNLEGGAPVQGVPLSTEPTSISPVCLKGDLGTAAAVTKQGSKVCMCCLLGNLGPCRGV